MANPIQEKSILDDQEFVSPFQQFRKTKKVLLKREDGSQLELESPFLNSPLLQENANEHNDEYLAENEEWNYETAGIENVEQEIDISKAQRNNFIYAESLGWKFFDMEILKLLGFTQSSPSEEVFAQAVASWQSRNDVVSGAAADGIIGSQTWSAMLKAIIRNSSFTGLDIGKAIAANRKLEKQVGWGDYKPEIYKALGFYNETPDETLFVKAVALWQPKFGFTGKADGILGEKTWQKIRALLNTAKVDTGIPSEKAVNFPGKIRAEKGIRLHSSPRPGTEQQTVYPQNAAVTIIATAGNSSEAGWIKIQTKDGKTGWIEEKYIIKLAPNNILDALTKLSYVVPPHSKSESLEQLTVRLYPDYNLRIGDDLRTIVHAFSILNDGNPAIYYQGGSDTWWRDKVLDRDMAETRKIYASIRMRAGKIVRFPTEAYIDMLKKQHRVGQRPDWKNEAITIGKQIIGFVDGVIAGFTGAGVDLVTGLWDLLKSIFTGEIFRLAYDLYKEFKDDFINKAWSLLKAIVGEPLEAIRKDLSSPNPMKQFYSIGKIVGYVLFEVVLFILTSGGSLVGKIGKLQKVQELLQRSKVLKKIVDKATPAVKTKVAGWSRKEALADGIINGFTATDPLDNMKDFILQGQGIPIGGSPLEMEYEPAIVDSQELERNTDGLADRKGDAGEDYIARLLRRGDPELIQQGLPKMDHVIMGQYNGSGHGMDLFGFNVNGNKVTLYLIEVKGSIHPQIGRTKRGIQMGEKWVNNAIDKALKNNVVRARLVKAFESAYPGRKITDAIMRKNLRNSKKAIVIPRVSLAENIEELINSFKRLRAKSIRFALKELPYTDATDLTPEAESPFLNPDVLTHPPEMLDREEPAIFPDQSEAGIEADEIMEWEEAQDEWERNEIEMEEADATEGGEAASWHDASASEQLVPETAEEEYDESNEYTFSDEYEALESVDQDNEWNEEEESYEEETYEGESYEEEKDEEESWSGTEGVDHNEYETGETAYEEEYLSFEIPVNELPKRYELIKSQQASVIGQPVTGSITLSNGVVVFHEYGCIWSNETQHLVMLYKFPKMGKPLLVNVDQKDLFSTKLFFVFHKDQPLEKINAITAQKPGLIKEILTSRFELETVRKSSNETKDYIQLRLRAIKPQGHYVPFVLESANALVARQLYNIGVRNEASQFRAVSPHAVYTLDNKSSETFGVVHATDLHVSKRIEGFRKQLIKAGVSKANAQKMVNWNDCFRDFIRCVNQLHREGKADIVMLTGDLIDYVFEKTDTDKEKGGNFAFLEKLILGQVPYPDEKILGTNRKQEELMVPVFVTLGNHDYRVNPYELLFKLKAAKGVINRTVTQYEGLNLTKKETEKAFGVPEVSDSAAMDMVKIDKTLQAYKYFYNRFTQETSYKVEVGSNQLLLLDTKWDAGMIEGKLDAVLTTVFGFNESKVHFSQGSPDSIGFTQKEISLVKEALNNNLQGVTIIGMHAPPINIDDNDYAHYLRETEHAHFTKDNNLAIKHFLLKKGAPQYKNFNDIEFERSHPDWLLPSNASYFKKGDTGDFLDYSVSVGERDHFLQLCAGKNTLKKADLVLFGHVHRKVEYRIELDNDKGHLKYYMDFYTEQPAPNSTYPTVYIPKNGLRLYDGKMQVAATERIFTPIVPNTPVGNNKAIQGNDGTWTYRQMNIPMYKNPLSAASDPKQWWAARKPLLIQTPALGPGSNRRKDKNENRQKPTFNFQGFRLISIEKNVIKKIKFYNNFEFMKFHNNG